MHPWNWQSCSKEQLFSKGECMNNLFHFFRPQPKHIPGRLSLSSLFARGGSERQHQKHPAVLRRDRPAWPFPLFDSINFQAAASQWKATQSPHDCRNLRRRPWAHRRPSRQQYDSRPTCFLWRISIWRPSQWNRLWKRADVFASKISEGWDLAEGGCCISWCRIPPGSLLKAFLLRLQNPRTSFQYVPDLRTKLCVCDRRAPDLFPAAADHVAAARRFSSFKLSIFLVQPKFPDLFLIKAKQWIWILKKNTFLNLFLSSNETQ